MPFQDCLKRPSKDVVLLHVVLHRHSIIVEPLLRRDELVAKIKKLFEAFTSEDIFGVTLRVVYSQDRVATTDVFYQKREHCVELVFSRSLHIKL